MFLSLVNFTTKYGSTVQLIGLTVIFYSLLAFIFGTHLFFIIMNFIIEREVYKYFLYKRFCKEKL